LPRCLLPSTLALLLLTPSFAYASPLIEAAGPVGGNGGLQPVVSGPSAASTYFNPALLPDADEDFTLGFALISEQVGITLDGRRGGDVPGLVSQRDVLVPNSSGGYSPLPNYVVPTQWLKVGCANAAFSQECNGQIFHARQTQGTSGVTRTYGALGLVKHLVKDRLSLGIYTMVPISSFTTARAFFVDEREAVFSDSLHPELYGDRLTAVSVVFALGLKLLPSLSIGAGLSVGLANTAQSADYVQNASDYSTLLSNNTITTTVNMAPVFGLAYTPAPWLRLAGSIHAPESFSVDTSISATLPDGTQSGTTQTSVFDWMPWAASVGAEARVIDRGRYTMAVVGSATYAWWSAYKDRQGASPGSYGPGLGWKNTPSGAIGTRQTYGAVRGYADFRYVPSPVPDQVGRSNYVDNDKVGVGLGADVVWQIGPVKLRPGLQLTADRLIQRHNTKDDALIYNELPKNSVLGTNHDPVPGANGTLYTNNPGWPGFASSGWIWGGAVTLSIPL
jgi:hypothetical protein